MSSAEAESEVGGPTGAGGAAGGGPSGTSGAGDQLDKEYGDIHKIVLQGLLSAGFLDTKGVKKLFVGACTYLKLDHTERTTMPYVQRIVREINDEIKPYDMAIKSASCEFTGRKFYIFLITVENSMFKLQTLFTKFELEIFQKCMDAILRKYNNYSVPLAECMNFAKDCTAKGSLQEAENFILRMIRTKYLSKFMISDTEFNVTMGFRGLREFEPLLKGLYQDVITSCSLCKMVLLHGLLCPNCKVLIHKHCFMKFIRTSKECPHCKISWTKPGSNEPIEMVKRLRDTAGETDSNIRTPATQLDPQQTSGDEEEVREPLEGEGGEERLTHIAAQERNAERELEEEYEDIVYESDEEADDEEVEGEDDDEGEGDNDEDDENQEEDDENIEYEGEGENQEENDEDLEGVEEDAEDEDENGEEEEEAAAEPPPTSSVRRSTRSAKKARLELNLSESDSD